MKWDTSTIRFAEQANDFVIWANQAAIQKSSQGT